MSWLGAILQGAGRAGNEAAQAGDIRLDQEAKKLAMLQNQMGLRELQQRLAQGAAPQFVGSHADPFGNLFNTVRDPFSGVLTDRPGGKERGQGTWGLVLQENGEYAEHNSVTGEIRPAKDAEGKVLRGYPKGKDDQPVMIAGKPGGVWHNGKAITPTDPDWTPQDAVKLASYVKTYNESNADKNKRVQLAAQSRAWAWLQMPLAVYDADTNSMTFASKAEIDKNPAKYAPPGPAEKIINQRRLFKEIDASVGTVNDSISKLPDDAFDAEARAQIALVLRDEKPQQAWYEFLNSDVAKTMSEPQMNYVTGLVSLAESAMALRNLGGLGQSTDKVRNAIQKMLPGAGTPSKAWAIRQMNLFVLEENALRSMVPNAGAPGRGAGDVNPSGNTPPPGSKIIKWSDVK